MNRLSRRATLAGLATLAGAAATALSGRARGWEDPLSSAGGPVFDDGVATTGPITIETGPESLIFRGLLGAQPVRVLLDSGASLSVVDLRLARRLRLEPTQARAVADSAGLPARAVQLAGVTLRLPGLTFLDLATVALDLSPLAETGQEVPMILGAEAFAALAVEVDRAAARVSFSAPSAARPPPGAVATPLRANGGRTRLVSLEVEGSGATPAQFDLGSQSPLTASLAYAQAHGWLAGKRVSTWAGATVSGVAEERIATLAGVRLGGWTLPPTPVELLSGWDTPDAPLLVGYPLLSRFRMLVDAPDARLWLAPLPGLERPFRRDRSGLAVRPASEGEGLEVVHVAAGSPAAAGGWRAGEVILSATDAQGRPAGDAFGFGAEGTRLRLRVRGDPRPRDLTLADYF